MINDNVYVYLYYGILCHIKADTCRYRYQKGKSDLVVTNSHETSI